jgi:hypothetical protein
VGEAFTLRRATVDDINALVELRLEIQREIIDGEVQADWGDF